MADKSLLVFSPFAAIWDHVLPELQVALAAQAGGWNVRYLSCNGLMEKYCISMHAFRLVEASSSQEKQKICTICRQQNRVRRDYSQLAHQCLEDFLTNEDRSKTLETIKHLEADTFLNFEFLGIPVGKLCIYEYLLSNKKNNLQFSEKEWQEVQFPLENCLNVLKALDRYWTQHSAERVLVYNSLYSVNSVVAQFVKQKGATVYFLHHGMSLAQREDEVMIGHNTTLQFLKKSVRHWPQFQNRPLPIRALKKVTDHLIELMRGKSVFAYSAAAGESLDVSKALGIPPNKKIIVVSMSSGDERFGIEITGYSPLYKSLFPTQVAWAKFLLGWATTRSDIFLIFRVHPREFPNKRERVTSLQAKELQELFSELPSNVVINWPDQNISLYDLAEYADVFLNAWSSVGKEMALLGFPVVIYSKDLIWYPADINYLGETEPEYLRAIDKALSVGWSIEHAISAYRWMSLEISTSHLLLHKRFGPTVVKWGRRLLRRLNKNWIFRFDLWRLNHLASSQSVSALLEGAEGPLDLMGDPVLTSQEEEREALKSQYRRLLVFMYPEDKKRKTGGLYDHMRSFLMNQPLAPTGAEGAEVLKC